MSPASGSRATVGLGDPASDARALAAHTLSVTWNFDSADHKAGVLDGAGARPVPADGAPAHRPVRTVVFRGIDLLVGPGAAAPRPEASCIAEWAVRALRAVPSPVVADLYPGAGAIALAVAHEVPAATVHAVERDDDAVTWTRRNAGAATLGNARLHVHHHDAMGCLPGMRGTLDLVASAPGDGLAVLRVVEVAAARLLRPDGLVAIGHAAGQGVPARRLLERTGRWADVEEHADRWGSARFVTGRLL